MALANGYDIYVKNSQGELLKGYYPDFFELIANVESRSSICEQLHDKIAGQLHVAYTEFLLFVIFECDKKAADKFMTFIKYFVETDNSGKRLMIYELEEFHDDINQMLFSELDKQIDIMFELFKASLKKPLKA